MSRIHVKYFFVVLSLLSQSAFAIDWLDEDCGRYGAYAGKLFSLSIATSFHGTSEFKLCKSESQKYLVVSTIDFVKVDESQPLASRASRYRIQLFEQEYAQVTSLYKKALSYNTLDDVMGVDGSTWCLESQRGINYTKACFWTPSVNYEERGLVGLYNLANYLWEFTGLNKNEKLQLY